MRCQKGNIPAVETAGMYPNGAGAKLARGTRDVGHALERRDVPLGRERHRAVRPSDDRCRLETLLLGGQTERALQLGFDRLVELDDPARGLRPGGAQTVLPLARLLGDLDDRQTGAVLRGELRPVGDLLLGEADHLLETRLLPLGEGEDGRRQTEGVTDVIEQLVAAVERRCRRHERLLDARDAGGVVDDLRRRGAAAGAVDDLGVRHDPRLAGVGDLRALLVLAGHDGSLLFGYGWQSSHVTYILA